MTRRDQLTPGARGQGKCGRVKREARSEDAACVGRLHIWYLQTPIKTLTSTLMFVSFPANIMKLVSHTYIKSQTLNSRIDTQFYLAKYLSSLNIFQSLACLATLALVGEAAAAAMPRPQHRPLFPFVLLLPLALLLSLPLPLATTYLVPTT